jgi:hypothetical protein
MSREVPQNLPEVLLGAHLKALKLPTSLREHQKLARQCAIEGVDHVRYLARLTELERIDRERRMVERQATMSQEGEMVCIPVFVSANESRSQAPQASRRVLCCAEWGRQTA